MTWETANSDYNRRVVAVLSIDIAGGTEYYAGVDIETPGRFYSGRVISFGVVSRDAGYWRGQIAIGDVQVDLANADGNFSEWDVTTLLDTDAEIKLGYEGDDITGFSSVFKAHISHVEWSMDVCRVTLRPRSKRFMTVDYGYVISADDWANTATYETEGEFAPIVYGSSIEVPCYRVTASKWIIAGHECAACSDVSVNGSTHADYSVTLDESFSGGLDSKITTVTFNASVPNSDDDVTATVNGVTDGGVLTYPDDMIKHFLTDYLGMTDGTHIGTATFTAVHTVCGNRSYNGNFGGAILDREAPEDILARMCLSFGAEQYYDAQGRYCVALFDPTPPTGGELSVTADEDIFAGSFRVALATAAGDICNLLRYDHTIDWTTMDYGGAGLVEDTTSQSDLGPLEADIELEWCRDADMADDVAQRLITRRSYPPRLVTFTGPLTLLDYDLTDFIYLTHPHGLNMAGGGYDSRGMEIRGVDFDIDDLSVGIQAVDEDALMNRVYIFGDNATVGSATWTGATSSQKRYGFLCDETTGKFSDGEPGKVFW